jgi:hypothetical protein
MAKAKDGQSWTVAELEWAVQEVQESANSARTRLRTTSKDDYRSAVDDLCRMILAVCRAGAKDMAYLTVKMANATARLHLDYGAPACRGGE